MRHDIFMSASGDGRVQMAATVNNQAYLHEGPVGSNQLRLSYRTAARHSRLETRSNLQLVGSVLYE
jgi:hypothetical protein